MPHLLRSIVLVSLPLVALVAISAAMKVGEGPGSQMATYTSAWLDTLDDQQRQKALLSYDAPERTQWFFIPLPTRKGLPLMEMKVDQQAGALRALRAALSEAGYDKAAKIMQLEGVLRQLEGPGSEERRNPEKYYVTVYGKPSATEPWGFSFEGHHLSLNFVCRDGKVVDSSPQFLAANPAKLMSEVEGPLTKGTRVLRQEEDIAFELITKLSEEHRSQAIIAPEAPAEIRFAAEPQPTFSEPEGIALGEMDRESAQRLLQLVDVFAKIVPEEVANQRLELIRRDGINEIHFAWAGATKPGIGHYYRVQGKSFLIELVNTQPDAEGNPANHIHAVWRDMTGDFDLPIQ